MKMDRLLGILTVLMQREKVTAPYLAEKFEVSRRTILRDIDTLGMAGIPVVTTQGGNGGISILEDFRLEKQFLTTGELNQILTGLKSLDSIAPDSRTELLIQKLTPSGEGIVSLPEHMVIDLSSHYKSSLSQKIQLLRQAISDFRLVTFDYYYAKGEVRRRIEPYFIVFKWSSWYVFGYCLERQDFRLFKLNRLWRLKLENDAFQPRDIPPERRDFDRFHDTDSVPVTIRLHPDARYRLIDDYGPACYRELEDGYLLFESSYSNEDYLLGWVLSLGAQAEILAPRQLRHKARRRLEQALALYRQGT
ncbi:MAG: YafY family transcriptional regulator [Clostridiales bacterium]|nr:YafY family transcriptional regulator [Clostridiales bacterium]